MLDLNRINSRNIFLILKYLKSINEFFDVGVFGDTYGYGGANGIFKIQYKPYKDLSVSVGPDPNVKRNIKGSEFQIGDIVIGVPINGKKKVAGMIVRSERSPDNKSYRYFAQVHSKGKKKEEVLELVPDTVEFVDNGNKGHMEVISKFKFDSFPSDVYNSPTVFNNTDLGVESVGS
jgi:hypothetical protein